MRVGRSYNHDQLVCDLHGTVQRSERISINTSTTLLFQQNLYTPFVTCECAHTRTFNQNMSKFELQ